MDANHDVGFEGCFNASLSPAIRFVLTIASINLHAQRAPVEPPIDLDWNEVTDFANRHGLVPLLCCNLLSHGIRVPGSSSLDLYCRRTVAKALRLSATLVAVNTLFSEYKIDALTFKGPSLASFLYSDEAMRSYEDLDFFFLPSDVKRARAALHANGWTMTENIASIHEHAFLQSHCEYGFIRDQSLVELQWAVAPRFYSIELPLSEMIGRAMTVRVLGTPVKTFATDDLFLLLAVHGGKHLWTRLGWVFDIASLLHSAKIDASRIEALARRHNLKRIVAVAVLLAATISDVKIPAPLSALVAEDPDASAIASALFRNAIMSANGDPPETLTYFKMFANLRESRIDRVRLFVRLLLTPGSSEWHLVRLPRGTRWLYRPIRVVRLAKRLLRSAWCAIVKHHSLSTTTDKKLKGSRRS